MSTATELMVGFWRHRFAAAFAFVVLMYVGNALLYGIPRANAVTTVVFLTFATLGTNTWSVPADWNSSGNTVEVIAAAANGGTGGFDDNGLYCGFGAGGGAYSKKSNISLTAGGTASYQVGAHGEINAQDDTWFKSTADVLAIHGSVPTGGPASGGVGDLKYNGGNGTTGGPGVTGGTGGGGAAGPNGAGNNSSGSTGGSGDAGSGGAGGTLGNVGSNGTEYDATHGSGGGGGGVTSGAGKAGGSYGAGGSGGCGLNSGGAGTDGLIVITYTPLAAGASGGTKMLMGFEF
jgi:hypothetical protein